MNLAAVDELANYYKIWDIMFVESSGDNLSATFSPELADLMIYVIDIRRRKNSTQNLVVLLMLLDLLRLIKLI